MRYSTFISPGTSIDIFCPIWRHQYRYIFVRFRSLWSPLEDTVKTPRVPLCLPLFLFCQQKSRSCYANRKAEKYKCARPARITRIQANPHKLCKPSTLCWDILECRKNAANLYKSIIVQIFLRKFSNLLLSWLVWGAPCPPCCPEAPLAPLSAPFLERPGIDLVK